MFGDLNPVFPVCVRMWALRLYHRDARKHCTERPSLTHILRWRVQPTMQLDRMPSKFSMGVER